MRKKNDYLLYSILLIGIVLSILAVYFVRDSEVAKDLLFIGGAISCFLLGICISGAKQVYYYNKAMDAWGNWQRQMDKEWEEKQKKGAEATDEAFKEFDGGDEQ